MLDNWVISRLSEPFKPEEVKWRVGANSMIMAYIDARQVAERLNYVVGAENWNDIYEPIQFQDTQTRDVTDLKKVREDIEARGLKLSDVFWTSRTGDVTGLKNKSYARFEYADIIYGGIRCSLSVFNVTKQDVGTTSMAEQMKGAHSDALKRAAVKFGIGSYLYDLKNLKGGYVDRAVVVEPPELPEWALPVERANPDEAILSLFEQAKVNPNCHPIGIEKIFSKISVMGNYNMLAPLVLKRAVYEELLMFIKNSNGSSNLPTK
jgi:hypothetical protein